MAGAVHNSWALVAPLRVGGGTRLKILEAMALGTPVISTTKGAEGIDVHDGQDILIAEKLTLFLEKRYLLEEMGRSAAMTASTFTWEKFRSGVVQAYKSMLANT